MEVTEPDQLCVHLERRLIHYCTPTLAAIKPANLFTFRSHTTPSPEQCFSPNEIAPMYDSHLINALQTCQAKLSPHGVRLEILAPRKRGALIYAYRPTLLKHNLVQKNISEFLTRDGYDTSSLSQCIKHLKERIRETDEASFVSGECSFPHEIGLFLGYPFEDVMGFIKNKGENFLFCGCWKVYSKERDAQACFCNYKHCTNQYEDLFEQGMTLEDLACVEKVCPLLEPYQFAG